MNEPVCDKCGEPITERHLSHKFGRKIYHFDCPQDARDRAWDAILDSYTREQD